MGIGSKPSVLPVLIAVGWFGYALPACHRGEARTREDLAGFRWGRLSESRSLRLFSRLEWGTGGSNLPRALDEAGRAGRALEQRAGEEASADAYHEVGVFHLLTGHPDEAVGYLKEAVALGGAAQVKGDLAAAYLARSEVEARSLDLVRAVSLAEDFGPQTSQELRINAGLALRRLGLSAQASVLLEESLERERNLPWKNRLETLLEQWAAPTREQEWASVRRQILAALEGAGFRQADTVVGRFPFRARLLGQEALGEWAQMTEQGDRARAASWLELAHDLGEQLVLQRQEHMLDEAVRSIEDALGRVEEKWLSEAYLAFRQGLRSFESDDTKSARPFFEEARKHFEPARSPFSLWAEFYVALCDYYTNAALGLTRFEQLAGRVDADRYPALAGRVHWLLGSASKTRRDHGRALAGYRRAAELLDRASGPAQAAFIDVVLAETLQQIGDTDSAWRHRAAALSAVPDYGRPRRVLAMLLETAWALAEARADRVALIFLEELGRVAEESGAPYLLASAHLYQGLTWGRLDRPEEARASLERAREALEQVPPGPLRDGVASRVDLAQGLALRRQEPRRALELLTSAMEREEALGQEFYRVSCHLALGEARIELGEVSEARADLLDAVEAFESTRGGLDEFALRVTAAREAQKALETILTLDPPDSPPGAESFRLAERLRARELLDQAARWDRTGQRSPTAREVAARLEPGTLVVHYTTLRDRILCWILRPGEARALVLPVDHEDLRGQLRHVRTLMDLRASEKELVDPLGDLHDLLVRPLRPEAADERIVFVPDRELSTVPFAALFDRRSGRYLLEDRATATVPSATLLYLHLLDRRPEAEAGVLIVGAAGPFASRPELERLPSVDEEIRRVAAEYPGAAVLAHEEATPGRFLSSLRGRGLVHFAGHALINRIQPARSILMLSPEPGQDAEGVSLSRALEHGLAAPSLVVLSACRTMDQEIDDRETPLGAAGVLYAAGVPAVVAGRWDVEDSVAARITPRFHRALGRGLPPAEALRRAVLESLEEERLSPSAWAALSMVGGADAPGK